MQSSFFGEVNEKPRRLPTMLVKTINDEQCAIRFERVGTPTKFNIILERFRSDFPLATSQELDQKLWWVILATQYKFVSDFATRNGLKVIEEG